MKVSKSLNEMWFQLISSRSTILALTKFNMAVCRETIEFLQEFIKYTSVNYDQNVYFHIDFARADFAKSAGILNVELILVLMEDLVIGIDLGTTNSCVSLYLDGKTRILENSDGGRITPSFIFFTSIDDPVVGEHARRIAATKPDHGIYEVKRLVGRTFTDSYVQKNLKYLAFKVERGESNTPLVVVQQRNKVLKKTPQELCSIILQKLKSDVEAKLRQTVNKVVITVPAYFNVTQREVTLAAAEDAGFTVLKLLNEPTAAALFYYFEYDKSEENYSLVYDLGGGTFDVAILKRSSNNIEIVCVDGDTQLGGHDFDNIIVNYVAEQLIKHYDYDPRNDKENLRRLHNKCEDAKKALSSVPETVIVLIGFVKDHPNIQISITREEFETIADPLFKRTMDIVDACVKGSTISKNSIKEVILSGGSTRIPKIQKLLCGFFDEKTINKFVNPDECVAEGAALQAAMLSTSSRQVIGKIQLIDVVPLSLGLADFVNEMSIVIPRNSTIPARGTESYRTLENRQSVMSFRVFEGERLNVIKNRLLGHFEITNITPAPPGRCEAIVTFAVDANGILIVTAQEKYKNNVKQLKINYARGNKSEEEINNSILDAEKYKKEDQLFQQFAQLKGYLIKYCVSVMYNLDKKKLNNTHRGIYEMCEETMNTAESMSLEEKKRVEELIQEIKVQSGTP
ncbi:heat shock 70 kDa protein-like [Zophobas morio]|uniref:heat shock 70 kDa protein-like n=1 Tax=Zophobas morio TaxID=2755281 RepID=UPI0030839A05